MTIKVPHNSYMRQIFIAAIAGVTWEIANYKRRRSGSPTKPIFQYGNGANYTDDYVIPLSSKTEPYELHFMAAQFPVWTGLELLTDTAKKTNAKLKVHLIGKLSQEDKDAFQADERFIQHGPLEWSAIELLFGKCVLWFSVFALRRKGFTKANAMNVKEYFRAGLGSLRMRGMKTYLIKTFHIIATDPQISTKLLGTPTKLLMWTDQLYHRRQGQLLIG